MAADDDPDARAREWARQVRAAAPADRPVVRRAFHGWLAGYEWRLRAHLMAVFDTALLRGK